MSQSITNGRRVLRPGGEKYDQYFPAAKGRVLSQARRGDVDDTVRRMKQVIASTLPETQRIAQVLKNEAVQKYGPAHTQDQLLRHVWEFWFYNVQYKLDATDPNTGEELEQLRTPARAWADRKTGIDCDCFTIAIGSTLANLGIPYHIRTAQYIITDPITGLSGPRWRHVYNYVPATRRVLDGVLAPYGYEEPPYATKDYPMSYVQVLGSAGAGTDPIAAEIALQIANAKAHPQLFSAAYPAADFIRYGEYALQHWNTPQRDAALAVLASREATTSMSGLGATPVKNFFTTVKNVVATAKGDDGKLSVKEGVKLVAQQSPAAILVREGVKVALHTNLFQIAEKLAPAYTTSGTAAQKKALAAVEKKWMQIGGLAENLQKAIMKGKGAKKAGVATQQPRTTTTTVAPVVVAPMPVTAAQTATKSTKLGALGEPITIAAVTASLPAIMGILAILKDNGLIGKVPAESEVSKALSTADAGAAAADAAAIAYEEQVAAQKTTTTTTTSNNTPLIIGGVFVAAAIGYAIYAHQQDQKQLATMTSSDKAAVMKRRAEADAAAVIANAAFNGTGKNHKKAAKRAKKGAKKHTRRSAFGNVATTTTDEGAFKLVLS